VIGIGKSAKSTKDGSRKKIWIVIERPRSMVIQQGQFVEVRGRPWLVEAVDDTQPDLTTLRLSCIADDAQGEQIEVLWDAEIGTRIIQDDTWSQAGRGTPDSPEVLTACLRAIRWNPPPRPTAICYRPRPSRHQA
jgi:hypothetical protein